jgi:hypothetical protein
MDETRQTSSRDSQASLGKRKVSSKSVRWNIHGSASTQHSRENVELSSVVAPRLPEKSEWRLFYPRRFAHKPSHNQSDETYVSSSLRFDEHSHPSDNHTSGKGSNDFTTKPAAIKRSSEQQFVDPTALTLVQSSVDQDRLELLLQPCLDLFFVVQEIKMDWVDFIDDPYLGLDEPFPVWRLLEMMSGLVQSIYIRTTEPKEFYGFTAKFGFWYLRTWRDGKRIQARLLLLEDVRIQITWEGTAMDDTLKRVRRIVGLPEFPISPDNEKIRDFLVTRVNVATFDLNRASWIEPQGLKAISSILTSAIDRVMSDGRVTPEVDEIENQVLQLMHTASESCRQSAERKDGLAYSLDDHDLRFYLLPGTHSSCRKRCDLFGLSFNHAHPCSSISKGTLDSNSSVQSARRSLERQRILSIGRLGNQRNMTVE